MVESVGGSSRRNDWGLCEEPPAPPPTKIGWNHEVPVPASDPPVPNLLTTAKPSRFAGVTGSNRTFNDTTALGAEVMRLKQAVRAPGHDASTRAAIGQMIIMRQSEWVTKAKREGLKEPTGPLDPFRASPNEVANAFLWSEAGGITPRDELARDGGQVFRTSIRDAVVLRTRGFDALAKLYEKHPEAQRALYVKELGLRGVKVSAADASNLDALKALYGQSLRNERTERRTMGLDGRVGSATEIDAYERQQGIHAMSPGSTLGSMMATYSALATGELDVDRMRVMGNAGNDAEGMLDAEPQYGVPGRRW